MVLGRTHQIGYHELRPRISDRHRLFEHDVTICATKKGRLIPLKHGYTLTITRLNVCTAETRHRPIRTTLTTHLIIKQHTLVEHHRHHTVLRPSKPITTTKRYVHYRIVLCCHDLKHPIIKNTIRLHLHDILIPQHICRQHVGHFKVSH